ncbi:MAG: YraN family protein [Candidatus Spechtbacterales bacterium]
MKSDRQTLGQFAEELVCEYLRGRTFKVLDRNVSKPWGELDIVAKDGDEIVCIEVKAQSEAREGLRPEDHFDAGKARRVVRACHSYLLENKYPEETPYRVDLATVTTTQATRMARVRYYKNALSGEHE